MQLLTNSTANYGITEHILIETDSILRALLINSHFSRYVCGSGGGKGYKNCEEWLM